MGSGSKGPGVIRKTKTLEKFKMLLSEIFSTDVFGLSFDAYCQQVGT